MLRTCGGWATHSAFFWRQLEARFWEKWIPFNYYNYLVGIPDDLNTSGSEPHALLLCFNFISKLIIADRPGRRSSAGGRLAGLGQAEEFGTAAGSLRNFDWPCFTEAAYLPNCSKIRFFIESWTLNLVHTFGLSNHGISEQTCIQGSALKLIAVTPLCLPPCWTARFN